MRRLFYLFISLVLFLSQIFANDQFMIKHFGTPSDYKDLTNQKVRIIRYSIKVPKHFPQNGPVFVGIGGNQETIEQMQQKYKLFEKTSPYFNNAAIVFVESRFFGNSTLFPEKPITSLNSFVDLRFISIVNDNVLLIKKLAKRLKTYNFLVYGVNYGGLYAEYVSYIFAVDLKLVKKEFKVLAWSSSPPLKILRRDSNSDKSNIYEINTQFANFLNNAGCSDRDIKHFGMFYGKIRSLTQKDDDTKNPILEKLNIDPIPKATLINATKTEPELLEFMIFLRNGIKNLAFKNKEFDENGNKIKETVLKKLCNAMKNVSLDYSILITTQNIEEILLLILPNYKPKSNIEKSSPYFWKIDPGTANNLLNRDASLEAYQNCAEWQLFSCQAKNDPTFPFANSSWDLIDDCINSLDYDLILARECYGLFGNNMKDITTHLLPLRYYPAILRKNAIITMNTNSLYFGTYRDFLKAEKNATSFIWHVTLNGLDGEEFENPKECDPIKLNSIRYTVFKVFACFADLIDKSGGICDSKALFDDIKNDDRRKGDTCPIDDSSNFPFGYKFLKFLNTKVYSEKQIIVSVNQKHENGPQIGKKNNAKKIMGSIRCVLFLLFCANFLLD